MEKAASLSMRPSLSDSSQFSHSLPARGFSPAQQQGFFYDIFDSLN